MSPEQVVGLIPVIGEELSWIEGEKEKFGRFFRDVDGWEKAWEIVGGLGERLKRELLLTSQDELGDLIGMGVNFSGWLRLKEGEDWGVRMGDNGMEFVVGNEEDREKSLRLIVGVLMVDYAARLLAGGRLGRLGVVNFLEGFDWRRWLASFGETDEGLFGWALKTYQWGIELVKEVEKDEISFEGKYGGRARRSLGGRLLVDLENRRDLFDQTEELVKFSSDEGMKLRWEKLKAGRTVVEETRWIDSGIGVWGGEIREEEISFLEEMKRMWKSDQDDWMVALERELSPNLFWWLTLRAMREEEVRFVWVASLEEYCDRFPRLAELDHSLFLVRECPSCQTIMFTPRSLEFFRGNEILQEQNLHHEWFYFLVSRYLGGLMGILPEIGLPAWFWEGVASVFSGRSFRRDGFFEIVDYKRIASWLEREIESDDGLIRLLNEDWGEVGYFIFGLMIKGIVKHRFAVFDKNIESKLLFFGVVQWLRELSMERYSQTDESNQLLFRALELEREEVESYVFRFLERFIQGRELHQENGDELFWPFYTLIKVEPNVLGVDKLLTLLGLPYYKQQVLLTSLQVWKEGELKDGEWRELFFVRHEAYWSRLIGSVGFVCVEFSLVRGLRVVLVQIGDITPTAWIGRILDQIREMYGEIDILEVRNFGEGVFPVWGGVYEQLGREMEDWLADGVKIGERTVMLGIKGSKKIHKGREFLRKVDEVSRKVEVWFKERMLFLGFSESEVERYVEWLRGEIRFVLVSDEELKKRLDRLSESNLGGQFEYALALVWEVWSRGLLVYSDRVLQVFFPEGEGFSEDKIASNLRHEIGHWLTDQKVPMAASHLPLWLYEGLANVFAGRYRNDAFWIDMNDRFPDWKEKIPRVAEVVSGWGDVNYFYYTLFVQIVLQRITKLSEGCYEWDWDNEELNFSLGDKGIYTLVNKLQFLVDGVVAIWRLVGYDWWLDLMSSDKGQKLFERWVEEWETSE